jgi:hypothetical protein
MIIDKTFRDTATKPAIGITILNNNFTYNVAKKKHLDLCNDH